MSYDGGLSVKIVNNELLKLTEKYLEKTPAEDADFFEIMGVGKKHKKERFAVDYEYLDCAYAQVCPKNLEEALGCVIELYEELFPDLIDENSLKVLKEELLKNAAKIKDDFKFVEWEYYHPDYIDENKEEFKYQNGVETYIVESYM